MRQEGILKRGKKSSWIRTKKRCYGKSNSWRLASTGKLHSGSKEKSQQQYIYVITNPLIEGWVKVGMSFDPYSRVKKLNTGNPEDLSVAFCYELKDGQTDKDYHPALRVASTKNNREWFQMSEEDAIRTIINVSARGVSAPNPSN